MEVTVRESLLVHNRSNGKFVYLHSDQLPVFPFFKFSLAQSPLSSVSGQADCLSVSKENDEKNLTVFISLPVYLTIYSLQFIVPEDECEEFGPGTQAQRWRPLQAVVAQVQVFQFTQGLRESNGELLVCVNINYIYNVNYTQYTNTQTVVPILPLEIQHTPESCYGLDPEFSGHLVNSMTGREEKAQVR